MLLFLQISDFVAFDLLHSMKESPLSTLPASSETPRESPTNPYHVRSFIGAEQWNILCQNKTAVAASVASICSVVLGSPVCSCLSGVAVVDVSF